jgi:hypothetical protein
MMTSDRFKELVEAYGASPARWPAAEREAALAFAQSSPDARRIVAEASALDRIMDLAATAPVTPQLQAKILASVSEPRSHAWFAALLPQPLWIPAAAFAASLILGVGAGTLVPSLVGFDAQPDAALVALGDADSGLFDEGDGS